MSDDTKTEWALAATGTAGDVSIDLSHDTEEKRWQCEIQLRKAYLRFDVGGEIAMRIFCVFVDRHLGHARFEEERIGRFSGCDVFIVKDDEFPDRFFLRARGAGFCFELTFVSDETISLSAALKSLVEDLSPAP